MIDLELRWQLVTACHILADSGLNDYVWGHAAVRARDESGVWMKPADLGMGEVEEITFDWVDWYNNRRLHSTLGNIPPEEYERNYYAETTGPSNGEAANKTAA